LLFLSFFRRFAKGEDSDWMASTFFRSVRSLEADNSQRSYLGLVLAASLLTAWILWFFLAHVSVYAVTNKADLEVERAAHPVESLAIGRVVATHMVLDQEVKTGDVLVELDSGTQQFQLREEKTQLAGADPQIRSREEQIASEEQAMVQDQQASKDALEEARAHYNEAEAAAQFAQAEAERVRKMYSAGVIAELDLNRTVADAQQRRAAADSLHYAVVRLEGEQRARTNERKAHIEQLTGELNKLRGDKATAGVTIQRLEDEVGRRWIRAPIDGRLGEVAPLRVGAIVQEGEKLAAVIPTGKLRVVANFDPPVALGRIRPGQHARLRLEGFPWAEYGSVGATVTSVASEIRDGSIRVEMALDSRADSRIPLQHGLPGSVEVEIETLSPANLVLRKAGSWLAGPKNNFTNLSTVIRQ
jgi:membrane fusion protein (multidrug efflux system)